MIIRWKEGKWLYSTLWSGAFLVIVITLLVGFRDSINEKNDSKKRVLPSGTASGETINELLLSAGQLSIAEKNSFINLYLKSSDGRTEASSTANEQLYKEIFQRKVNKLKKRNNNEDFSIKPVPK